MSLFNEMLGAGESLFKQEDALDPEYLPKLLPYRELQQKQIASAIKPLFSDRNGRNLFVFGSPGIGKTAAARWVLRDLEETTDEVLQLFINCWQKNSTYKIMLEICSLLDYKFTQNKNTDELFNVIKNMVNKKSAVFVFDEIDKVEDLDFLYAILNDIEKKTVVLITNYKNWIASLEDRIKSRLLPETLEFKSYTKEETKEILKQRIGFAFVPGVWAQDAFELVASRAGEIHDVRAGLFLLRQAGLAAEEAGQKRIALSHAQKSIEKLSTYETEKTPDLESDEKLVLELVKSNSGKKIGELFELYTKQGGTGTYKTFQRRIEKLEKGGMITSSRTFGGKEGNTTVITYQQPKLTEF
ncbi:MAG: AAA family ATPase [Candidatus Aenigmarchaeota archaeon]|nr:AAA family ATPase [Candidatus Aenigmarchaeota archaeon]